MYLLYQQLGISALIGALVCIIVMVPLQFVIGSAMARNSKIISVRCIFFISFEVSVQFTWLASLFSFFSFLEQKKTSVNIEYHLYLTSERILGYVILHSIRQLIQYPVRFIAKDN